MVLCKEHRIIVRDWGRQRADGGWGATAAPQKVHTKIDQMIRESNIDEIMMDWTYYNAREFSIDSYKIPID